MTLERASTWAGLRRGDRVDVAVAGPGMRSATWEFIAHVHNQATGEEWVEVVGGKRGDRKLRSFRPGDVFPHRRGRPGKPGADRPSLAEAPQLPLG